MSLQLALALLGLLALAGLAIHSAWGLRRSARLAAQQQPDSVAEAPPVLRVEPVLDGLPLDWLPPERPAELDVLIDVLAPIRLDHAVSGDAVLAAQPGTRRVGTKPFALEAFNEDTQTWEHPLAARRYRQFQAGVQLVNRSGALNEIEYSEFVVTVQRFCDLLDAQAEFPDMLEEVARARELDQFASAHDAHLSFSLHARGTAWSVAYVQRHAARLGLVPGALPARLVLPAPEPGLPPLLALSFDPQAALSEDPSQTVLRVVKLALDVPVVARAHQPYVHLREVAAALCQAMDAVLTDERGQPLSEAALDAIAADLEHLYQQLEARDVAAGSSLARRLFS